MFFGQKIPFENFVFRDYLYLFISIYTNELTQLLNLSNTFDSNVHLKSYALKAKLDFYLLPKYYSLPRHLILLSRTKILGNSKEVPLYKIPILVRTMKVKTNNHSKYTKKMKTESPLTQNGL